MVGLCPAMATVSAAQDPKTVLVLYATRRDAQIVTVGDRELRLALQEGLPEGLDYYSEVLDRGRFAQIDYERAFRDFLKLKYGGRQFDLIIAMGELPLEFVVEWRDALFGVTPVVYFSDRQVARPANAAGVIAELNLTGTLQLATALQPDARNVFVVAGNSEGTQSFHETALQQFRPFASQLAITYLTGLPSAELEARLAQLPPRSLVYYLIVERDGAQRNFHPLDYLDRVTAIANAPVYSWVDSAMGHGIVGGSLKSQAGEAQAVGGLALRVLRGEAADSIPQPTADLNVRQVDWRQLRRWGISEARVPAGTEIRFRELSVWDRYGDYIAAALLLLLAQSVLIATLLIQRNRRHEAEAQLLANQAHLRESYNRIRDLASRLLDAQETERSRIARELHDDISQQMALLEIDLEQLGGVVRGKAEGLTHEVRQRAHTIARSVHDLSHELHPAKLRLIGLVSALQGLRSEVSQPGVSISFTHDNVPPALPEDVSLCLFRIVQEALHNAMKHSGAKHLSVDLRAGPGGLTLTVADDGVGFDVDRAWQKGIGLISVNERVEAVGGSLEIHSTPGAGTRLKAVVPLPLEETVGV